MIPPEWRAPVPGVELPPLQSVVADWMVAFDGQTGRLDQANDRTMATIGIVSRCEERDAEAIRRATRRRVLGIF